MNELLQQLVSMGPGLGAAAGGNGEAFASFMDGYQRTMAQIEQQKRLKQQDALTMEDRQLRLQDRERQITRQDASDAETAKLRAQQQALQGLQIPGHLAEMGAGADSPESAKALIEAAMPNLMSVFGQETMAYGQPAVEMAQRAITGRQKKAVEAFVDQAMKTAWVADNPDSDPEMMNLPEHIAKIVGKPAARLSELQSFAQLPVGKPAKRPGDDVSWQIKEGVGPDGKPGIFGINPKTLETKPVDGIRPEPPKPTGGDAGLTANQTALLTERLAKSWNDSNASSREMKRQLSLMETGLKRFRAGDKNGGSQAVLVTFQKILDPTSVVRETEYARSAQGISMLARLQGAMERLQSGGAGVPDKELEAMVETARQMLADMDTYSGGQRSRIDGMAKKYQIDPVLIYGMEPQQGAPPPSGAAPARPGTNPPKKNPFRP